MKGKTHTCGDVVLYLRYIEYPDRVSGVDIVYGERSVLRDYVEVNV